LGNGCKDALIARDLMIGNPRLAEIGWEKEALGITPSPVGSRVNVTGRIICEWDFMEAILNSSFDLEWNPPALRVCHRER